MTRKTGEVGGLSGGGSPLTLGAASPADCDVSGEDAPDRWPDVVTASDAYQRRFRGSTGRWFLQVQRDAVESLAGSFAGGPVLDVGGGHGHYTRMLADMGCRVIVLGSGFEADRQIRGLVNEQVCEFLRGSLDELPFPDRSFPLVISTRMMTHRPDWQAFVAELCRIARGAVIVDIATRRSSNILYPLLFRLKRRMEGPTTRPFIVFAEQDVHAAFHSHGFDATRRIPQFLLPMGLHRHNPWTPVSIAMERIFDWAGLTRIFGSPVMLRFDATNRQSPEPTPSRPA